MEINMAGISFPFAISKTGSLKMSEGPARTKSLVASAILTSIGERASDPTKGIVGMTGLFRPFTKTTEHFIKYLVKNTIEKDFPQLRLKKLSFTKETTSNKNEVYIIVLEYIDTVYGNNAETLGIELFRV